MSEHNDHDLLIRLDEKMDSLGKKLVEHIEVSEKIHNRQCSRLDALEQWKWRWVGAVSVGVFVLNIVAGLVVKGLMHDGPKTVIEAPHVRQMDVQ